MDLQIILMTLKTMLLPGKNNSETNEIINPVELQINRKEDKEK